MKNSKSIIVLASLLILDAISKINDVTQFYVTIKEQGQQMDWLKILPLIGDTGILIILLYYVFHLEKIKSFFKTESEDFKDYRTLKKTNEGLVTYNKHLTGVIESNMINQNLSLRIFRDAWLIPSMIMSEEAKEQYAKLFSEMGFTKDELEKYFLKVESKEANEGVQDIINKFLRIHHETEAKKLKT